MQTLRGAILGFLCGAASGVIDALIIGLILAGMSVRGAVGVWILWLVLSFGFFGAVVGALWAGFADRMRLPPPEDRSNNNSPI
jgi:hypothetical protein